MHNKLVPVHILNVINSMPRWKAKNQQQYLFWEEKTMGQKIMLISCSVGICHLQCGRKCYSAVAPLRVTKHMWEVQGGRRENRIWTLNNDNYIRGLSHICSIRNDQLTRWYILYRTTDNIYYIFQFKYLNGNSKGKVNNFLYLIHLKCYKN